MKIVQINTVPNGCTGRIACGIKKIAEMEGHECIIAYGRGNSDRPGMMRIGNRVDPYIHGLLTRLFDSNGKHSKYVTRKFVKWLERYNPDIIHIHSLHGYYINFEILFEYIKKNDKRVVWTLHDSWAYTGHCPVYAYVDCNKWEDGCYACVQKRHHPTSWFIDRSTENYEDKKKAFCGVTDMTIATPSNWLKGEVRRSFLKEYNVMNIPNGIDLNKFHATQKYFRKEYNIQDKIIILGVANLWSERKGIQFLTQLSEQLDDNYQVVLVGLNQKQKDNLPDSIIGITRTENIDVLADIYSSADIFVNPTLEDNFPTTNIEALACGTPVVTFNTGGSPESIIEGCGVVAEEKTSEELARICSRLGRKDKATEDRCCEHAKNYSEEACFKEYVEIYEKGTAIFHKIQCTHKCLFEER